MGRGRPAPGGRGRREGAPRRGSAATPRSAPHSVGSGSNSARCAAPATLASRRVSAQRLCGPRPHSSAKPSARARPPGTAPKVCVARGPVQSVGVLTIGLAHLQPPQRLSLSPPGTSLPLPAGMYLVPLYTKHIRRLILPGTQTQVIPPATSVTFIPFFSVRTVNCRMFFFNSEFLNLCHY